MKNCPLCRAPLNGGRCSACDYDRSAEYEYKEGAPESLPEEFRITDGKLISYDGNAQVVHIPEGVTEICPSAFEHRGIRVCEIPEGVTRIGEDAFRGCGSLSRLSLPSTLTEIGMSAFWECYSLKSLDSYMRTDISANPFLFSPLTEIINRSDRDIKLKDESSPIVIHRGESLLEYEDGFCFCAVNGENYLICYEGESVSPSLPESYKGGSYRIRDFAFRHNGFWRSVTVPSSVLSIGRAAFEGCNRLSSVTITDGLLSIGDNAFDNCELLVSLTLPSTLTDFGISDISLGERFYELVNNSSVHIDREALFGKGNGDIHTGESKLISLDGFLFYPLDGELSLICYSGTDTDIYLPDSVNGQSYVINEEAFSGMDDLVSVTLPDWVETLPPFVFEYCDRLEKVSLPASLKAVGIHAFWGCEALREVILPEGLTEIGDYAFYKCKSLTSVTLPDSVTAIGKHAFELCEGLREIAFSTALTELSYCILSNCRALTDVRLPSKLKKIGKYAFLYCVALTDVSLPDGLITVDGYAFEHCHELKEIIIPDTVTELGEGAFMFCRPKRVILGRGLKRIGANALDFYSGTSEIIFLEAKGWRGKKRLLPLKVNTTDSVRKLFATYRDELWRK